jgi:hypothetical protein
MFKEKGIIMKDNGITSFFNKELKGKSDFTAGFVATTDFNIIPINDNNVSLEKLQKAVDGYIELVAFRDDNFEIIVDEEGLIKSKKINLLAYAISGLELAGTVVFLKRGILK